MKISITLLSLMLVLAIQASSEFVSPQSGRTANLLKRSLCNTFGGCGAKRSIMPHLGAYRMSSDEALEERHGDDNAKLIAEILEDIVEHLQKDQNYKQGKYVMFVPKQSSDGMKYVQRLDADGMPVAVAQRDQPAPNLRAEEELINMRALN